MNLVNRLKELLPAFISLALAVSMVTASELLNDKEIIFPEITAITIGTLASPKQSWNTSKLRLLLTITASAVVGLGLVIFIPLALVFKIPLAMLCAITCVTISGTEFLPAISACVLPVLLGTRSPVYIGSVVAMTSMILLAQLLLEKFGIRDKSSFTPVKPDRQLLMLRIRQIIAASLICVMPVMINEIFFIAPPLIVAFFEMSKPKSKLMEHPYKTALLIVIGAVSGVLSRYVLTEKFGLPLAVSAMAATAVILVTVSRTKMYFPPCGAIATLPFIIPEGALLKFPFEITVGTLVFIAVAYALSNKRRIAIKVMRILRPQN